MNDELKTKDELLADYAEKPVRRFLQIDGWHLPHGGDDLMHPDKDGDWMCWQISDDLRTSDEDLAVRVQIESHAKKDDVRRLLTKILENIDGMMDSRANLHGFMLSLTPREYLEQESASEPSASSADGADTVPQGDLPF